MRTSRRAEVNSDRRFEVIAVVGASCIRRLNGAAVSPVALGLTSRLVNACEDWAAFFTDVAGDLGDPVVAHEFVSQGYKIAHKIRSELKGSEVWFVHPVTSKREQIVRTVPR